MTYTSLIETAISSLTDAGSKIIEYLPRLLAAAAILAFGWLVARLIRALIVRLVKGLDHLWHKVIVRNDLAQVQNRYPPTKVVGEISFWVIMLLFISMAADILNLATFVNWISQVVSFFPLLIAGLVIVLAGIIISSLVRDLVESAASSAGTSQVTLLGRVAQFVILLTAVVLGVDQIGIDITFLSIIAGIFLATTLGAVAIAFGLGAKNHVANIIAGYNLRHRYKIGDTIRINDIKGKILIIGATRIVVDTADGQVSIPAKIFDTDTSHLVEREE